MLAFTPSWLGQRKGDKTYLDEARELLLQLALQEPAAYHSLGYLYLDQGQYAEAEACFRKLLPAVEFDPSPALAQLYFRRQDYEQAERTARSNLERSLNTIALSLSCLASIARRQGAPAIAKHHGDQLVTLAELFGRTGSLLFQGWMEAVNVAEIEAEGGRPDSALDYLEKAFALAARDDSEELPSGESSPLVGRGSDPRCRMSLIWGRPYLA